MDKDKDNKYNININYIRYHGLTNYDNIHNLFQNKPASNDMDNDKKIINKIKKNNKNLINELENITPNQSLNGLK